jgi:S-adenosylmethionine-diacylgycerolhomoserine-N-methlytransferase
MSAAEVSSGSAAGLMDRIYRRQRHIYDASRKFYLLGRDQLIDGLQPPKGGSVLEIGCGTGRNLIRIAQRYPDCACHGLDVSNAMLATAQGSVAKAGLEHRIDLAQADATGFDPQALFGRGGFDRIVISYALSMIPPWQGVVAEALRRLSPGGSLHIVDFGDQEGLPRPFKAGLLRWLALFHVTPRENLPEAVQALAKAAGADCRIDAPYRGYAVHAVATRRRDAV